MINADISNFIEWFINIFVEIGTQILNIIDNIKIYETISLLDFIITITIIGIFINIILTLPQNANKLSQKIERRKKIENNDK